MSARWIDCKFVFVLLTHSVLEDPDEICPCFPSLFMCVMNKGLLPISSWKKRGTYHLLYFVSHLKGSNPLRQETNQAQQMIYLHWKICPISIKSNWHGNFLTLFILGPAFGQVSKHLSSVQQAANLEQMYTALLAAKCTRDINLAE